MLKLEDLKQARCIPKQVANIQINENEIKEYNKLYDEEVIVPNYVWIATTDKKALNKTENVYSFDNKFLWILNSEKSLLSQYIIKGKKPKLIEEKIVKRRSLDYHKNDNLDINAKILSTMEVDNSLNFEADVTYQQEEIIMAKSKKMKEIENNDLKAIEDITKEMSEIMGNIDNYEISDDIPTNNMENMSIFEKSNTSTKSEVNESNTSTKSEVDGNNMSTKSEVNENNTNEDDIDTGSVDSDLGIICRKVKQTSAYDENIELTYFNTKHGRLEFFITPLDVTTRLAKTNESKLVNGKKVLKEDKKAEYAGKDDKSIPKSATVTECRIRPRQASAGKICGVVLKVPSETFKTPAILNKEKVTFNNVENPEMRSYVLPIEDAKPLIAVNFRHGEIIEDERVAELNNSKPVKFAVVSVISKGDSRKGSTQIKIAENSRKIRKNLLTNNNYIPYKKYVTANIASYDEKECKGLNLALESLLQKSDAWDKLASEDQSHIKFDIDSKTVVSSDFYPESGQSDIIGKKPYTVKSFFNKDIEISDISMPIKIKEVSKSDNNKFTYKFLYTPMFVMKNGEAIANDDPNAPLETKIAKELLNIAGIEIDDFVNAIVEKGIGSTRSNANKSSNKNMITGNKLAYLIFNQVENRSMAFDLGLNLSNIDSEHFADIIV